MKGSFGWGLICKWSFADRNAETTKRPLLLHSSDFERESYILEAFPLHIYFPHYFIHLYIIPFNDIASRICIEHAGDTNINVQCKSNVYALNTPTLFRLEGTSACLKCVAAVSIWKCIVRMHCLWSLPGCSSPRGHMLTLIEAKFYCPIKITSHPTLYPIFCPTSPTRT